MCTCTPIMSATCASDTATLLPSPTYAMVRPRTVPQCSCSVRQSARAWHGCSSSLSALTTLSAGAAAANRSRMRCENVRIDDRVNPSLEAARHVLDRLAGAERRFRLEVSHVPPSSVTAISNVTAGPERRLLEEERHVPARERLRRRRLPAERAVGLHLRREVQTPLEIGRLEVQDREKVLAGSCDRHVLYSPLIFTYSALRSHVHTVDDALPAPR